MGEPYALQRLKRVTEEQQRRERDAELAARTKAVTTWHERNETRPGVSAKDVEASNDLMEADLKAANEALIKVRRERLKALYQHERDSWQAELGSRGLAMETGAAQ